jgi:peptidoglycan/LPS O-acetylase OafA/YrhL
MSIGRSIGSVIVGYLIFALSAFALFQISGQPPHQAASAPFIFGSIIFGAMSALLGGYLAAWLAKRRPLAHGFAVAAVLALGAAISLLSTLGKGRDLVASCGSRDHGAVRRHWRLVAR